SWLRQPAVPDRKAMAEADKSSEGSALPDALTCRTERLANFMSKMELLRPEVLRVIPAYKALGNCGAALRFRDDRELAVKSEVAERIEEFWSHSWHGEAWKKYLTLLVLKNGVPAVLLGTCCALLGLGLFLLGVLPRLTAQNHSLWALLFGAVGSCGVFAFWRPKKRVFLDRACISQADDEMKAEAICSLGGLLNKSDSMLVLWDATLTERLWCVFELAAFLKSTKTHPRPLMICPTLAGPCAFVGFWIVAGVFVPIAVSPLRHAPLTARVPVMVGAVLVAGCGAAHVFRGLCRSVEVMQKQLLSLKVAETKCTCCTVHHLLGGQRLLCDRQVICECMTRWFGSVVDFEQCIRTEVADVVSEKLDRAAFGDTLGIGMAAPAFWAILDILSTPVLAGEGIELVLWVTVSFIMLFLVFPTFLSLARAFAFHFRQRSSCICGEIVKDLLVMWCASPVLAYALGVFVFCGVYCAHLYPPIQAAVCLGLILPMWTAMRLLRSRRGDKFFTQSLARYRLASQTS
ncbi:unnamed protein product, partial [Effrenium voratum]